MNTLRLASVLALVCACGSSPAPVVPSTPPIAAAEPPATMAARVLKIESDEIVAAVKKNGVPVEYLVFDDEGHGFRKQKNRIAAQEACLKFLDTYLPAK